MTKKPAQHIEVDWQRCKGHGLCMELLPEVFDRDPWGYPIVKGPVPVTLGRTAKRAIRACPALALRLKE